MLSSLIKPRRPPTPPHPKTLAPPPRPPKTLGPLSRTLRILSYRLIERNGALLSSARERLSRFSFGTTLVQADVSDDAAWAIEVHRSDTPFLPRSMHTRETTPLALNPRRLAPTHR